MRFSAAAGLLPRLRHLRRPGLLSRPGGGLSALLPFLREIRRRYPRKNIWCFTGFRLEDELLQDGSYPRCAVTDDLLHCIDILVDGRFLREEKDISLQFRGSRNQRIIDLPRTLSSDRIVLWDQLRR